MHETHAEHLKIAELAPDSLGSMLARARTARRLEQREVATRLALDLGVVQALEHDEFERIGAPVFVRGYLIRYARLLGLDEADVLARFKQLGMTEPPPLRVGASAQQQARMSDAWVRGVSFLLVVGTIVYLGWLGFQEVTRHLPGEDDQAVVSLGGGDTATLPLPAPEVAPPSPMPPPGVPTPTPTPTTDTGPQTVRVPTVVAPVAGSQADSPQAVPEPLEAPPPADAGAVTTDELPADRQAVPSSPAPADPVLTAGQARLELSFNDDCWVEVRDADGNRLIGGIMKRGASQTLRGQPPFRVVLGNAPAVTLLLNGKPVGRERYVPQRGVVSRFVLDQPGTTAE